MIQYIIRNSAHWVAVLVVFMPSKANFSPRNSHTVVLQSRVSRASRIQKNGLKQVYLQDTSGFPPKPPPPRNAHYQRRQVPPVQNTFQPQQNVSNIEHDLLVRFGIDSGPGRMVTRILTLLLLFQPVYVAMGMEVEQGVEIAPVEAPEVQEQEPVVTAMDTTEPEVEPEVSAPTAMQAGSNTASEEEVDTSPNETTESVSGEGDTQESEQVQDEDTSLGTDDTEVPPEQAEPMDQAETEQETMSDSDESAETETGVVNDDETESGGQETESEVQEETQGGEPSESGVQDEIVDGEGGQADGTQEIEDDTDSQTEASEGATETQETSTSSGGGGGAGGSVSGDATDGGEASDSNTEGTSGTQETEGVTDEEDGDHATSTATSTDAQTDQEAANDEAATTTPEVDEGVVNVTQNPSNKYVFGEGDCTVVSDGEFYCVADGPKRQQMTGDPRVYAQKDRQGDKEIYFFDGIEIKNITNNSYDDFAPVYDEENRRIVWQAMINDRLQIMMHELPTNITRQITTSPQNSSNPSIAGDTIVWQEWVDTNWEIMMADIGRNDGEIEIEQLTNNVVHDMFPSAYDGLITWQSERGSSWEVIVYDMHTGKQHALEKDENTRYENPRFVLLFDSKHDNGDVETVGYDLDTGEMMELGTKPGQVPVEPVTPKEKTPEAIYREATSTPQIKIEGDGNGSGDSD